MAGESFAMTWPGLLCGAQQTEMVVNSGIACISVLSYDLYTLASEGREECRTSLSIQLSTAIFSQLFSGRGSDAIEAFDDAMVKALRRILKLRDLESQLLEGGYSVCRVPRSNRRSCSVKILTKTESEITECGEQINATILKAVQLMYQRYLRNQGIEIRFG